MNKEELHQFLRKYHIQVHKFTEYDAFLTEHLNCFDLLTKFHIPTKNVKPLNRQECRRLNKLLESLDENFEQALSQHVSEYLKITSNRFLVDPYYATHADIAVYLIWTKTNQTSVNTDIDEWIKFVTSQLVRKSITEAPEKHTGDTNFIKQIIYNDLHETKDLKIITRFPPEPNGYLHLGHAKSICINFGLAQQFNGRCHLRFDDTNPEKEDMTFIESIQEDVKWMGYDWGQHLYFTSDYFQQLHDWAIQLIQQGDAYVDSQSTDDVRKNRGDITAPGVDSIYRTRTVEENMELFQEMIDGKFGEGECVLRAKIDMAHGNPLMRDPLLYRIKKSPHPKTGHKWIVYPTYDFAHGQADSIEKITHSICTLEFEDHRPLYEWLQERLDITRTRQIEFARLKCTYMPLSKRKLTELVNSKVVDGWDDPRLPTLAGLRRRGVPASALVEFCESIGVSKRDTLINYDLLQKCITRALHPIAFRYNVVLEPLRVVITNFDKDRVIQLSFPNHPEIQEFGTRQGSFSQIIYIDRKDFQISPPKNYHRLAPGREVRLKYGFWIKCHDYKLNTVTNQIDEIYCTYDPSTQSGIAPPDKRKVKGSIHWVSEHGCVDLKIIKYSHLFTTPEIDSVPSHSWESYINHTSKTEYICKGEATLQYNRHPYHGGVYCQFEREGYFVADYISAPQNIPAYHMTIPLVDTWSAQSDINREAAQKKIDEVQRRKKAAEVREQIRLNRTKKLDQK